MRGFGARGRGNQLRDYVRDAHVDLICLQETIKPSFSSTELSSIACSDRFVWRWLPASGHSGGILIGAKIDVFDFVAFDHGNFVARMVLSHRDLNKLWEVVVVYGPANHSLSQFILDELTHKACSSNIPLLIGCDFNLLRSPLGYE